MKTLALIFIGGGLGSLCRYWVSSWLNNTGQFMPYGTLLSNILACFILGFGAYWFESKFPDQNALRLMVLVGFCGGFSTFSTFSNELFGFLKTGNQTSMLTYMAISVIACNLAIGVGVWAGKFMVEGN